MLDLLISYINFLILSIQYIVKRFTFKPPNPPRYKIMKTEFDNEEDIYFIMKDGDKEINKKNPIDFLNVKYIKVYYHKNNKYIPTVLISPIIDFNICIIYCQGNSGDLGTSLFECHEIAKRCNSTIITFEYPGYGICKNDKIEESEFFERIKIIYWYVRKELDYKPERIFLYGFSLGTGIVFDFICKNENLVSGAILQSPFLSILRTVYDIKKTNYFDLFNNCDKAKKLRTSTLILHGNKDPTVPYIHGRILAKLIPEQYLYDFLTVYDGEHNNLLRENKDAIFNYINIFISDCILKAKNRKKIKFNNYFINFNTNKKSNSHNFSENDDLYEKEESKKEQSFENNKYKANTYNNFKLNVFNKSLNLIKNLNKFPINKNETFNNQNIYYIESTNFEIIPENKILKFNKYKSKNIKNSSKNDNYYTKIVTNKEVNKKDKFRTIYKRNIKRQIINYENNNDKNNQFEMYNSIVSINSSNAHINNNK